MSDERPTKESPPAAFCSESVATIDTVKRPYCPRNPCAFFAALQGKRCAMVNDTGGGGNGMWHRQGPNHTARETTMRCSCRLGFEQNQRRTREAGRRHDRPGT